MAALLALAAGVEGLADEFGVTLPDQPKSSQRAWIDEISGKQGVDFDRDVVTGSARRTAACSR